MEGNCVLEAPQPAVDMGCADELNRWNSDAPTLTTGSCGDILHRSANVKPDDSTIWTDEKHSLYLKQLEVSFVKQLHQSMGLLARHSEQKKRGRNISQMQPVNVQNASEQLTVVWYGSLEKIKYKGSDRLSRVSADSSNSLTSPSVKRMGMHCPSKSDMPELLTLCGKENHGKTIASHGFGTCARQFSASSQYHGDLNDLMREGTGQNFVDEDDQNKSNTKSSFKRLKTALADSSSHNQIVPSKKCPTTDY